MKGRCHERSGASLVRRLHAQAIRVLVKCAARNRDRSPTCRLGAAQRVMVVKLDSRGDLVLASAFFRELRRNAPRARVTALVNPGCAEILQGCPYVDEVRTYEGLEGSAWAMLKAWLWAFSRRLTRVDFAFVPRWDIDLYDALPMAWATGARSRMGFSEEVHAGKALANKGFDNFLTLALDDRSARPEVYRGLQLLQAAGAIVESNQLECWVSQADRDMAVGLCPDGPHWIAIGPGAASPTRRWPAREYAEVVEKLNSPRVGFAVLGSSEDARASAEIAASGDRVLDLAGRLSLNEAAAVIERCVLFIGADSGLAHIAAAVGTPCVVVSCHWAGANPLHSNAPERFAPWQSSSVVVRPRNARSPCRTHCAATTPHCINGVEVREVCEAAESLLASTG